MRDIKFRAWDKKYQEMVKPANFHDLLSMGLPDEILKDYEWLQYTGLKDKHGVEIYEGDILSEPVSPVGGKDGGYLYKNRVIKWLGAGDGYKLFSPGAASEVIGNIYENPELLETP